MIMLILNQMILSFALVTDLVKSHEITFAL